MKLMIASDIHGSAPYCRALLERYRAEGADKLLLLGDLLYHGPRNDLPDGYAPKEVIVQLSELKNEILCVRGNCDTEVDQMVLPFPLLADYAVILDGRHPIYATHGHVYGEDNPPRHPALRAYARAEIHGARRLYLRQPRLGLDTEGGQPPQLHDA